ncbi:MAG: hypothetical protein AB7I50_16515 [Vicinamibacterales bacterium]
MSARESFRSIWRCLAGGRRLGRFLLVVTTLAMSAVASAQDSSPASIEGRVSLRLPLAVYSSSAVADLYTTHAALRRGVFYEKNPMGAWLDHRPTALVAFSATADAAIVWGLHRWLAPRHSRVLRVGLYAAAGARFWFAARNASATRAYDRQVARR